MRRPALAQGPERPVSPPRGQRRRESPPPAWPRAAVRPHCRFSCRLFRYRTAPPLPEWPSEQSPISQASRPATSRASPEMEGVQCDFDASRVQTLLSAFSTASSASITFAAAEYRS
eukprot:scaffold1159_cov215-Pinguiococcus_pyrenoidosus.AAC.20